jgi:hypothetical protein
MLNASDSLLKQGDARPPTKDPMRHLFDELAADWDAEEDAIAKIELEHPPTLELLETSEVFQICLTICLAVCCTTLVSALLKFLLYSRLLYSIVSVVKGACMRQPILRTTQLQSV